MLDPSAARYAHWLDPEYSQLRRRLERHTLAEADQSWIRIVKLCALLGSEFVLSDMQLTDSSVVLRLFADPDFRRFVRNDPTFLRFVAQRGQQESRFDLVTTGLRRSLKPGWISSTMETPARVRLANEILSARELDPELQLRQRRKGTLGYVIALYPKHELLMRGMVYALAHFTRDTSPVSPSCAEGGTPTFYSVLQEARDLPEHTMPADARRAVEETLRFIDATIESEKDRHFRSAVLAAIRSAGDIDAPNFHMYWHTTVQAWNTAVQRTVAFNGGGSLGSLPGGPTLGLYLDSPTDAIVPAGLEHEVGQLLPERRMAASIPDPTSMTWTAISEASKEAEEERSLLRDALRRRDTPASLEALDRTADALAKHFVKRPPPPSVPLAPLLLLKLAGVDSWIVTALFGARVAESTARWSLYRLRRYFLANTITKAGREIVRSLVRTTS